MNVGRGMEKVLAGSSRRSGWAAMATPRRKQVGSVFLLHVIAQAMVCRANMLKAQVAVA